MPGQAIHRHSGDPTPTERLARAIHDIDRKLETFRRHGQPVPLSAYRARRILQDALARCRERSTIPPPAR